VAVEGDKEQARLAWKTLGGGDSGLSNDIFIKGRVERYDTKFVEPLTQSSLDDTVNDEYKYEYQGEMLTGVVINRIFEKESRLNAKIPTLEQQQQQFINHAQSISTTNPTALQYSTTAPATPTATATTTEYFFTIIPSSE